MGKLLRKKLLRRLALWLVPLVGGLLIRLLYLLSKKVFHLPLTIPPEPVIFACWHGDLLMQPYLYYHFRDKPNAKVIISEHFDGQLIAGIIRFFGLGSIHGSTTRGGAKVLMQGVRFLEEGYDIGITPDGPKGPRYTMNEGIVLMAQRCKAKIIVFHTHPSRYWQLGSWDRFVIPKPFGTLQFYASDPIDVTGLAKEEAKALIHTHLMRHALL